MTTDESVEAPVPGLLRARVTSPMLEIACTASAEVATTRLGSGHRAPRMRLHTSPRYSPPAMAAGTTPRRIDASPPLLDSAKEAEELWRLTV